MKLRTLFFSSLGWIASLPMIAMFIVICISRDSQGELHNALTNAGLFISWGLIHSFMARDSWKKWIEKYFGPGTERIIYIISQSILFGLVLLFCPLSNPMRHGCVRICVLELAILLLLLPSGLAAVAGENESGETSSLQQVRVLVAYYSLRGNTEQARGCLTKGLEIFERLGTFIEPGNVREELADL